MSAAVIGRFARLHGTSYTFARRRVRQLQKSRYPLYVVAIGTDRRYGGPEEGGWWYDESYVLEVASCRGWRAALRAARSLKRDYPTCPYGRFSAAGGTDVSIRLTDCRAELDTWSMPTPRPHYE
ncbi:MAG: hypothetical protein ACO3JL_19745 [Myxococcota bacterium]